MGNCGSPGTPNTTNVCSGAINDNYVLPGFCSIAGPAGDSYRSTWCSRIGVGEWRLLDREGPGCNYYDCNNYSEYPGGCCNGGSGCCAIVGQPATCQRIAFNGSPPVCCLRDYDCNLPNPDLCFQDSTKVSTCDPKYRSSTSPDCQTLLPAYCAGEDLPPGDISWIGRWIDNTGAPVPSSCINAIKRNIFSFPDNPNHDPQIACSTGPVRSGTCPSLPITSPQNEAGLLVAQQIMNHAIVRYEQDGFQVGTLPGYPGFNTFQDTLYSLCCNYPAICQTALPPICSSQTSQRLALNPIQADWCGCFLPAGEYQHYVDELSVNKECTPTCNRPTAIPNANGLAQPIICNSTVCVIDDISISLLNSTVSNGINISQICGGCQSGSAQSNCTCIISNDSFIAVNEQINGSIDLSQQCASATCSKQVQDQTGATVTISIPCSGVTAGYNPYSTQTTDNEQARLSSRGQVIVAVILFLLFLALILVLLYFAIAPNLRPLTSSTTVTLDAPPGSYVTGVASLSDSSDYTGTFPTVPGFDVESEYASASSTIYLPFSDTVGTAS